MLENARSELRFARSSGIPIFIYHNFQNDLSDSWKEKLELTREETMRLAKYRDGQSLATDLVTVLGRYIRHNVSLGWIRNSAFQAINQSIEKINYTRSLLDSSEPLLNTFITSCKVDGLRQAFERCGIVAEKPQYGEQTWFSSRDNPIQRFFPQERRLHEYELPILFEKLPNRFRLLSQDEDCLIVHDDYLQAKWWTLGIKRTSYDEALSYAQEVSQQRNQNWRLPTIEEMATLITRSRKNRKYMDEKVFPRGRWFWTSSRIGSDIYYIDFNYMQGSIHREDISIYKEEFPMLRKKSVILILSDSAANKQKHPSDQSKDQFQKYPQEAKKMDPASAPVLLQAVEFLFNETSTILAERRARRKEQGFYNSEAGTDKSAVLESTNPISKEELLRSPIIEAIWLDRQKEVEHLTTILRNHAATYYIIKEQIAHGRQMRPLKFINEDSLPALRDNPTTRKNTEQSLWKENQTDAENNKLNQISKIHNNQECLICIET
jgi:hypothetical protein